MSVDPAGGGLAKTVEESIDDGQTHVIRAAMPETRDGTVEVVDRGGTDGGDDVVDSTELAALAGLLTLGLYGYLSKSGD